MKKYLILIITFLLLVTTSCQAKNQTSIYIGDDGYWYINNEKTGNYSIGNDGKSAYELAVNEGYQGTLEDWLNSITNKDGKVNVFDRETNKNLNSYIETINGQILLVVEYVEEVTINEGILSEKAYEDYSFYEIFEENSYAPINMDSYETETDLYSDYSGTTTIQSKIYNTTKSALYVEGTTSQQAKSTKSYSGNYYIAAKVNCTRYEKGYLGIVFGSDAEKYKNTTITSTTDGFITVSDIQTLSDDNIFIGSAISANLDGYIDDPVVVDLSIFNNTPSVEQMNAFYERYLKICKGEVEESSRNELVTRKKTYLLGESHQEFTDAEAKRAFFEYMNAKAVEIGMKNTTFIDAAGFYNRTTAYDLLRLAVYACGYDDLVETWHKNEYTITINGQSPRSQKVTTTVGSPNLEDYYFLFGGKTGTVDGQSNLLCVVEGPDERLFACIVLGTSINRFAAAKQALDAAMIKYYDKDADNSSYVVEAKSAAVCIVPKNNTLAYTDYPLTILYEKDMYSSRTPASITKVMTSICMLDFVADINESFIINDNDLTAGSGYYFYGGDIITYKESLHAMLLPSSNTAAEATATAVGHKILEYASR